jgi:cytochrome c oxidase subunit III
MAEGHADAHGKHHDYHLVDPSPWPLVGAVAAFVMAVGLVFTMKNLPLAGMHIGPYVGWH